MKYQVTLALLLSTFSCSPSIAAVLNVNGTISGSVNGEPLAANTTGIIDTNGGGGSATITFLQLPSNFHPAALSWSLLSVACGNGGRHTMCPGVNLFDLTGGNYDFKRQVNYPAFPNSSLQTVGSVSTFGNILNYNLTVSGNYDGPTNLLGVSDYKAIWEVGELGTIKETGGATIDQNNSSSFQDYWTTTYSTGGSALPQTSQLTLRFTNQSFDGTTLSLKFEGEVKCVPEPTSTLSLLALGTLGAGTALKRKLTPSKSTEKETTKV